MDIKTNCRILGGGFDTDLDGSELYNDIFEFKMLLLSREDVGPKTPIYLLTFIISYGYDVWKTRMDFIKICIN